MAHVTVMYETIRAYTILLEESRRKRPFWRPDRCWDNDIKVGEVSGSHGDDHEDDSVLGYKFV
jgi:hypothetical protein